MFDVFFVSYESSQAGLRSDYIGLFSRFGPNSGIGRRRFGRQQKAYNRNHHFGHVKENSFVSPHISCLPCVKNNLLGELSVNIVVVVVVFPVTIVAVVVVDVVIAIVVVANVLLELFVQLLVLLLMLLLNGTLRSIAGWPGEGRKHQYASFRFHILLATE